MTAKLVPKELFEINTIANSDLPELKSAVVELGTYNELTTLAELKKHFNVIEFAFKINNGDTVKEYAYMKCRTTEDSHVIFNVRIPLAELSKVEKVSTEESYVVPE